MLNNNIKYLEKLLGDAGQILPENKPGAQADLEFETVHEIESHQGDEIFKQGRVDSLIWAFRDVGYLYANLNPLGDDYQEHYTNMPLIRSGIFEELTIDDFSLIQEDLDRLFYGGTAFNHARKTLREIIGVYRKIYCSTIGAEFLHIQNKLIRRWFIRMFETGNEKPDLSKEEKIIILDDLIKTEEFEHFLHRNYIGQKRFSIEGAEVVLPCLHYLVNSSSSFKIKELVIGTTHRGRLAILNHILQLSALETFSLFEDNYDPDMADGGGDVKYHIGYTMDHKLPDGNVVKITLPANSSHLESVDSIVEGIARGLQDSSGDIDKNEIIPVILHGEAAFSGQGVAVETLNISELPGYSTGGTIHIIINNQVGFTTSPRSEHSSGFATDIAKSISAPILHVNGDDPEAAVKVMKIAIEYRQEFKKDIIIDIICYRRYGHNEGDDPSFTHPRMYEIIKNHKSVASIYSDYTIKNHIITEEESRNITLPSRTPIFVHNSTRSLSGPGQKSICNCSRPFFGQAGQARAAAPIGG